MKYVALLRGINVGGNSIIKMVALKEVIELAGFTNVKTYIQSGNVIFDSVETDSEKITENLEASLFKAFTIHIRVVVVSHVDYIKVMEAVPADWKKRNDIRCYIAFVKPPVPVRDVISEIELKEGVDFIKEGHGVIYMTTLLSGLTKSRFTKLAGKKVYQDITIRNYNTAQKLLTLMKESH